jgi:hypothetical protein
MPFKPRFWITTFNLAIAGLAGFFVCVILLRGGPITCGHHWQNDLMLLSALALTASAGTAGFASFVSSLAAELLWRKAQWTLAWVCYGLAFCAIIPLIQDGLALGFQASAWGNAIAIVGMAIVSGLCATTINKYLR